MLSILNLCFTASHPLCCLSLFQSLVVAVCLYPTKAREEKSNFLVRISFKRSEYNQYMGSDEVDENRVLRDVDKGDIDVMQ